MSKLLKKLACVAALVVATGTFWSGTAHGQETTVTEVVAAVADAAATAAPATLDEFKKANMPATAALDTFWVLICGALVFWMNAGFALVESGLCRQKNCVNILAKNFVVFACASLSFYFIGFGLMFGSGTPFYGKEGMLMLSGADYSPMVDWYGSEDYMKANPESGAATNYTKAGEIAGAPGAYGAIAWTGIPLYAKFFFQLVFAGTAATIVSGAVAERIKFGSFVIFSFVLVAFMYPITGHWIWGAGYLAGKGFFDFAGSTVVHSVGGWAALAGIIVLGPRLGKYVNGKVKPIPGHSLSLATLGVFILWLGWFGFNPGSTMMVYGDGSGIAHIFVTTNTAAVAAIITSMLTAWIVLKKPDLSMILNGCLAGLVAITAPCAYVSVQSSLIIGAIAGVLVVLAVVFFDKIKIDDPVGALSVHLVNGVFGTLCVGLFAEKDITINVAGVFPEFAFEAGMKQVMIQLQGIIMVGLFTFILSLIVWYVLKFTLGIRVSPEEESEGLDIGEHGNECYPDFQIASKG
jgi:ammonium transporter, Amt family